MMAVFEGTSHYKSFFHSRDKLCLLVVGFTKHTERWMASIICEIHKGEEAIGMKSPIMDHFYKASREARYRLNINGPPINVPFNVQEDGKNLDQQITDGETLIGELKDRLSLYIHKCSRVRDVEDSLALYLQNLSNPVNGHITRGPLNIPLETEQAFKSTIIKSSQHLYSLSDFEDFKVQRIQNRISKILETYHVSLQKYRGQSVGLSRFHLPQSLLNLGRDQMDRTNAANNFYQGNNPMNPFGSNRSFYPPASRNWLRTNGNSNKSWGKMLGNSRMFMSQDDLSGQARNGNDSIQRNYSYEVEKLRIDNIKLVLVEFFSTELFCCIKQLETLTLALQEVKHIPEISESIDHNDKNTASSQSHYSMSKFGDVVQELQNNQELKNSGFSGIPDPINPALPNINNRAFGGPYNFLENSYPYQQRPPQPFFPPQMNQRYRNYPPSTSPYFFPGPNAMLGGARPPPFMGGMMNQQPTAINGNSAHRPVASPHHKEHHGPKGVSFDPTIPEKLFVKPTPNDNNNQGTSTQAKKNESGGSSSSDDYSTTESDETESSVKK